MATRPIFINYYSSMAIKTRKGRSICIRKKKPAHQTYSLPQRLLLIRSDRRTPLGNPFDYTAAGPDREAPRKAQEIYAEFLEELWIHKNNQNLKFDWDTAMKKHSLDSKYLATNFLKHGQYERNLLSVLRILIRYYGNPIR